MDYEVFSRPSVASVVSTLRSAFPQAEVNPDVSLTRDEANEISGNLCLLRTADLKELLPRLLADMILRPEHYLPEGGGRDCVGMLTRFLDGLHLGCDRRSFMERLPEELLEGAIETAEYLKRAQAERFADFSQPEARAIADWLQCFSGLAGAEEFSREAGSALLYWRTRAHTTGAT